MSTHYASGNWQVTQGSEEEFISRWRDWLTATARSTRGFRSAHLLRDEADGQHFMSYSDWDDAESRHAWRQSAEFAEGLARVRELCDDFAARDYTAVVDV